MFSLILLAMLVIAVGYLIHLHSSREQLLEKYNTTMKVDHDWMLFENRLLGPAIVTRMETLITSTDLRVIKKDSELLNFLVTHELVPGAKEKTTLFDYKEAGYIQVRDSGPGGLSGARISVYRNSEEPGLLIACYEDFQLKWFFHTLDLPQTVVKNKNKFIEDLYYNWLRYTSDKHFIHYLAKSQDVKSLKKNAN